MDRWGAEGFGASLWGACLRHPSPRYAWVLVLASAATLACRGDQRATPEDDIRVLAEADSPNTADFELPLRSDTGEYAEPLALPDAGVEPVPIAPEADAFRQNGAGADGRPSGRVLQTSGLQDPTDTKPGLDPAKWTELITLDPTFVLDLRYATANNFVGEQMYDCGRCFLRRRAAESLARIQDSLRTLGLGFKLYDCYRPLSVQWRLWNKVPDRRYVADPRRGSQHNRGVAVDLTLVDLATGRELDMGTEYDFFGKEAWHASNPTYPEPIRGNRTRLLELMEGLGWRRTSSEWWHYSYRLPKSVTPIEEDEWPCD